MRCHRKSNQVVSPEVAGCLRSTLAAVPFKAATQHPGSSSPPSLLRWGCCSRMCIASFSNSSLLVLAWSITGEVGPCRTCMGELPPNQVGGGHGNWPSQDQQGAVAEGGNTHPAATPPSQQGWWVAALKGTAARVDRRQPATSGDTAWFDFRWQRMMRC